MEIILYGLFLAHVASYRENYCRIGATFAMTICMKYLVKASGNKEDANLVAVAGGALTFQEFMKLLNKMAHSGHVQSAEGQKIIGGLLGGTWDLIQKVGGK